MTVVDFAQEMKRPFRLNPKGQIFVEYQQVVPRGVPVSMLISGEFFAKVAAFLRPYDLIDCVEETGAWEIKLRLRSKTADRLHFAVLSQREAIAA